MQQPLGIVDSTLREGQQVLGVQLKAGQRLQLARALFDSGVELLDVGVPRSADDWAILAAERELLAGVPLAASILADTEQISRAADAGFRHCFVMLPASEIHLQRKFERDEDWLRVHIGALLAEASRSGVGLYIVAEDASRGSRKLLEFLVAQARDGGAEGFFFCDTVGILQPQIVSGLVEPLVALASPMGLGVHFHNDLGMATANSVLAAQSCRWISTTLNGLGERAGNADTLLVAAALAQTGQLHLSIPQKKSLVRWAKMFADWAAVPLSPLHPIAGENAFCHTSGIHTAATLNDEHMYEAIRAEDWGQQPLVVLSAISGHHLLRHCLHSLGVQPAPEQFEKLYAWMRSYRPAVSDQGPPRPPWTSRGISLQDLADQAKALGIVNE